MKNVNKISIKPLKCSVSYAYLSQKKGQTEPVLSTVSVTLPDTFNFTKNELVFFKMLYIGK